MATITREFADTPSSLTWPSEQRRRLRLIEQPHVKALNDLVRLIRRVEGKGSEVPFFDPVGGGITSRCLCLFDAPAEEAVESGFVSLSNSDHTAKNTYRLFEEARIPRSETVVWNATPWRIGECTGRSIVNVHTHRGLGYLLRLLNLLPRLEVIVLAGACANKVEPFVRFHRPEARIFVSVLPGDRKLRSGALRVLQKAAAQLHRQEPSQQMATPHTCDGQPAVSERQLILSASPRLKPQLSPIRS